MEKIGYPYPHSPILVRTAVSESLFDHCSVLVVSKYPTVKYIKFFVIVEY